MPKNQPSAALTDPAGLLDTERTKTPPPTPPEPEYEVVAVDFEAFIAAAPAESKAGIRAKLTVPEFVLDADGLLVIAEDQSRAVTVRLTPFMEAAALQAIAHSGGLVGSVRVLESLVHPDDVAIWRNRIGDAARPVAATWLALASQSVLEKYGIATREPGKAGS